MTEIVKLLLWLHILALGMGMGGGVAMSQIGPRLTAAPPEERGTWWPLANVFGRIADAGLVLLLVTGPLLLWLKYAGGTGLNLWFHVKMGLVAAAVVLIGLSHWGKARLKRGDEGGGKLMALAGPLIMLTVLAIVLAAVFAFD
jgi:hypothetical protein